MCVNGNDVTGGGAGTKADSNCMFRKILVAVDDSKQARWAVQMAGAMAEGSGAEVALVHAYRVDPGYSPELATPIEDLVASLREHGDVILKTALTVLPSSIRVTEMLVEGEAALKIVEAAERWGADVILVGTHGRGRIAQFLLGSTAESVVRLARCPVMTLSHEPAKRVACCCQQEKCAAPATEKRKGVTVSVG
jgi:nucleotide-binding universal stress UspA family protein